MQRVHACEYIDKRENARARRWRGPIFLGGLSTRSRERKAMGEYQGASFFPHISLRGVPTPVPFSDYDRI